MQGVRTAQSVGKAQVELTQGQKGTGAQGEASRALLSSSGTMWNRSVLREGLGKYLYKYKIWGLQMKIILSTDAVSGRGSESQDLCLPWGWEVTGIHCLPK